ncbi:uncharacterized protein BDR25DRAFT_39775 [Lindgomyces ingoldianus]|uniref:Uncharacterized protein n=1 Tax=Lindgomyces ingoldianus TaxID=673940 RepID=A0ACB6QS06_9PLEO|nr:uncharacterized protein BDR25DRAFT_39775 [Lindgomyces ingoldianus]KAF2469804.1 hypothetical protein BDR25DRAFT_39775 [Lindgomyces ingoldianus]
MVIRRVSEGIGSKPCRRLPTTYTAMLEAPALSHLPLEPQAGIGAHEEANQVKQDSRPKRPCSVGYLAACGVEQVSERSGDGRLRTSRDDVALAEIFFFSLHCLGGLDRMGADPGKEAVVHCGTLERKGPRGASAVRPRGCRYIWRPQRLVGSDDVCRPRGGGVKVKTRWVY